MKAKPEDVNMQPVGFRITRILTDSVCQKLLGYWIASLLTEDRQLVTDEPVEVQRLQGELPIIIEESIE